MLSHMARTAVLRFLSVKRTSLLQLKRSHWWDHAERLRHGDLRPPTSNLLPATPSQTSSRTPSAAFPCPYVAYARPLLASVPR